MLPCIRRSQGSLKTNAAQTHAQNDFQAAYSPQKESYAQLPFFRHPSAQPHCRQLFYRQLDSAAPCENADHHAQRRREQRRIQQPERGRACGRRPQPCGAKPRVCENASACSHCLFAANAQHHCGSGCRQRCRAAQRRCFGGCQRQSGVRGDDGGLPARVVLRPRGHGGGGGARGLARLGGWRVAKHRCRDGRARGGNHGVFCSRDWRRIV